MIEKERMREDPYLRIHDVVHDYYGTKRSSCIHTGRVIRKELTLPAEDNEGIGDAIHQAHPIRRI